MSALLVGVSKIAIKICNGGRFRLAEGNNIFNDCGTDGRYKHATCNPLDKNEPEDALPRSRYESRR